MEYIEHHEMVKILGYKPNTETRERVHKALLGSRYIYSKSDVMAVKHKRDIRTLRSALKIVLDEEVI